MDAADQVQELKCFVDEQLIPSRLSTRALSMSTKHEMTIALLAMITMTNGLASAAL